MAFWRFGEWKSLRRNRPVEKRVLILVFCTPPSTNPTLPSQFRQDVRYSSLGRRYNSSNTFGGQSICPFAPFFYVSETPSLTPDQVVDFRFKLGCPKNKGGI